MGLQLSQIYDLLHTHDGTIHFEHLPEPVAAHLGSRLRIVYLSNRSLRHILDDHADISEFDILILPFAIKDGYWIAENANVACVFYRHPDTEKLYKVAVKVAANGYEVYVCSLYRCNERQVLSSERRGTVLAGLRVGGRLG